MTPGAARERAARLREVVIDGAVVTAFAVYASVRYLPRSRLGWGFDRITYTAPNQAVAFESLRHLHLPQWNVYLFGGAPHLANPQVGALYPLKLPFLWVSAPRAVLLMTAMHLVLLGLGMVVLLRHELQLRRPAVVVGSVAAATGGVAIAQLSHFEQLITMAWIPWLLVVVDRAVRRRSHPGAATAVVALVVALLLLCGHQQPAYYALLLAGAWAAGRAVDERSWRGLVSAGVGVVAGFALAAAQLLPTSDLVGRSVRAGGLTLAAVAVPGFQLEPRQLLTSLFGDAFATFTPLGIEMYAAIGAGAVVLLLIGGCALLAQRHERGLGGALSASVVLGILLSFGGYTPVYRVLFGLLPGLDLFRVPGRALVVFAFAGAVLVAAGADAVLDGRERVVAAGLAVAGGGAALAVVLPLPLPGGRTVMEWAVAAGVTAAAAALACRPPAEGRTPHRVAAVLVVAVPLLDLAALAYQPLPDDPPPSSPMQGTLAAFLRRSGDRAILAAGEEIGNQSHLRATLRPNVNATERVRSLDGYDGGPWLTRRWTQAMEAISGRPFAIDYSLKSQLWVPVEPKVAARYGVRWFGLDTRASDPATALPGWRGPVVTDGPMQVFENPDYRGEATLYRTTRRIGRAPLYEQLATDGALDAALVEAAPQACSAADCSPVPLHVDRPRPEHIAVDTKRLPGTLVVAESWDPGWRVEVDGRERPLVIADRNFLAVEIRPGDRRVDFRYRTPGLRLGIAISSFAALALAVAALWPRVRRGASRA